jgi:hypothetical protein
MRNSLLRPLLVVEFLLAIQVVFTLWSQVGGQYHLDLMFWPWKLVFGVGAAWLIVAITAALVRNEGELKGAVLLLASLLLTLMLAAGAVTYYYHLNEPPSEDDQEEERPAITSSLYGPETAGRRPTHTSVCRYQTLQEPPPRTMGSPALQPNAF